MIHIFHTAIVNKLKAIPEIKAVYFGYNSASSDYPMALVKFNFMESDYEDNIRDRRIYNYDIILCTLIKEYDDRNKVYKDFEELLVKVNSKFGRNSIQGSVLTRPTDRIDFEEIQGEQNQLMGQISVQVENIERPTT